MAFCPPLWPFVRLAAATTAVAWLCSWFGPNSGCDCVSGRFVLLQGIAVLAVGIGTASVVSTRAPMQHSSQAPSCIKQQSAGSTCAAATKPVAFLSTGVWRHYSRCMCALCVLYAPHLYLQFGHETGQCHTACSSCGWRHKPPVGNDCAQLRCQECKLFGHDQKDCPGCQCNRWGCALDLLYGLAASGTGST